MNKPHRRRPSTHVIGPETVRFLRRAAPAFFRRASEDYKREILPAPHRPAPQLWPVQGLHTAWIGHSSVLLSIDGFTILTDPVLSDRVGINLGPLTVGIKRLVEPAADLRDLPPIDLILLSHAHMDHFDIPTLRQLENRQTQVVTASETSDLLRVKRYASVKELRWGEAAEIGPVQVSAFEVSHWGARMRSDVFRGYNGYLIESGPYRILFGGDTAYTHAFRRLRSQRGIQLALMPVGAYNPWIAVHCNPEQAWQMANDAGAEYVMPIHHQTFQLGREARFEPVERILHAAGPNPERICVREIGQEFHIKR